MTLSTLQLVALAVTCLGYSWLAFRLGMNHERDSRGRRIYRETIGAAKDDPVFRSMASDVKRRAAVKRMGLRVIAGGTRDRGPFGGRAA